MTVTICHNPDCATSRNALALIRNSGVEPRVVEYLEAPPQSCARSTPRPIPARRSGMTVHVGLCARSAPR